MNQVYRGFGLSLTRFALSAWIGAATLFVINGIRLVTADVFDSFERDHIGLLRFPPYYATGATLMTLAVAGLVLARGLPGLTRRRWMTLLILTMFAGAVMAADYLWVYRPLAEMITPPGGTRPEGFQTYHRMSESMNTLQVAVCLIAAWIGNWPLREHA